MAESPRLEAFRKSLEVAPSAKVMFSHGLGSITEVFSSLNDSVGCGGFVLGGFVCWFCFCLWGLVCFCFGVCVGLFCFEFWVFFRRRT